MGEKLLVSAKGRPSVVRKGRRTTRAKKTAVRSKGKVMATRMKNLAKARKALRKKRETG